MDDYNFWQDFFDTYQSLSDWLKLAWLIVPPLFILGFYALVTRFRLSSKKIDKPIDGELVYSVHRDESDQLHIYQHGRHIGYQMPLLLVDQANNDCAPPPPTRRAPKA